MTQKSKLFIERWQHNDGTEQANSQLFLTELCELLTLPKPDPATIDTENNAYVFERRVDIQHPNGETKRGRIDLYKRGCFVLESKQTHLSLDSSGWDKAMLRAHSQADNYIRALPADEGRPPFLIVIDVGRSIELYAEFSQSGATYVPFPDPRNFRIKLEDLAKADIQERLKKVWQEPLSLDPSRQSARITREIANQLAELAKALEQKHSAQSVAHFLMRCLFTMFAEDVGLIPHNSFTELLESLRDNPDHIAPMFEGLWKTMNDGGFSPHIRHTLLRFNGGLFAKAKALPLNKKQLDLLIKAAHADWSYVEPAIFGTLLERALESKERHKLGAHYTPRAYVERLVLPTVIEPLREQWQAVQVEATVLEQDGKAEKALQHIKDFHYKLCNTRVLDPACGTGNFLYIALEHMKRLEGEVLNVLEQMDNNILFDTAGLSVDPHQFLGLEINPRAAAIADMVLWIGYLQWHFKTKGNINPVEPILHDFKNIRCKDALLAYDSSEIATDSDGNPLSRWDGISFKTHPITGKQVPDDSAQVPILNYINPRKAIWPQADYIVGNPPFIGAKSLRDALGDGYAETLRKTWKELSESSDFVMYWWHKAAETTRTGKIQRFGFITTNSIKQTFNRRVIQSHLEAKKPLSLIFAIPDHPWVDATDGAAVRIAMSVGQAGDTKGKLKSLIWEQKTQVKEQESNEISVKLKTKFSKINADLTAGANVAAVSSLRSNSGLSSRGVQLIGSGFIVTPKEADFLGNFPVIREYRNGRDIAQSPRGVMVIDLFGLTDAQVKRKYPAIYQWVLERVKPERDQNKRKSYRDNWWVFGEARQELRRMCTDISRYISTVATTKHRFFVFLEKRLLPDDALINITLDNAYYLGVLSSRVHYHWVSVTGSTLGVTIVPRYNKTRCFETFPFPTCNKTQQAQVRRLAEQLDKHRKQRQAAHPDLTLTGMYNVLEKIRLEQPLSPKEKIIHEQGLVSVLAEIHDDLDRAVFTAYGWEDLADVLVGCAGATTPLLDKSEAQTAAEETLLSRLVALNLERAAEEKQGKIRWLRPEFQAPEEHANATQTEIKADSTPAKTQRSSKPTWPKEMQTQIQVVRDHLSIQAMNTETLASQFKRKPLKGVTQVLAALEALGLAKQDKGLWYC